jgi:branched-chain amino acid transport system ATP-binding protein
MSILLEAKQVSKFFGGVKAVNLVDMQIEKGEIFGIIGPNGAGKTTFFNVISGLYTPTNGDIWFKGEKITGIIPEKVARMGMARTFQNIRLFVNMSVTDNIKIGFHTRTKTNFIDAFVHSKRYKSDEKLATEKSLELLEKVGLSEFANYQAGKLAYGTQRKVEIVRALALNPEILLLDEPAAGMNPAETESLMLFVKELNQNGYTIAVIEHDMKFIMHLCDRIMVLDHGNKIAEGLPEEIKEEHCVIEAYFGSRAVI